MARRSEEPQALRAQTERLLHDAHSAEAAACAKRLLAIAPDNEHALILLTNAEISSQRPAHARNEKALKKRPDSARLARTLASALRLEGRPDEALSAFERTMQLYPNDDVTRCALAEIHLVSGDADAASTILAPIVQNDRWDMNSAIIYAQICKALRRESDAVTPVERVLQQPDLRVAARAELCFRLGELRDRLHLYDSAFAAFDQANRTLRVFHDPDATKRAIDDTIAHWTRDALDAMPTNSTDASRVVLIVGMPRSGTSVVEQILSSHPDLFGADGAARSAGSPLGSGAHPRGR